MSILNGTDDREFRQTHPWITFQLDLTKAGHALWMDLGAIQSKCEHVARSLLPPAVAQDLFALYLAKGAQATTAIEGNTLSEEQVLARIKKRGTLPPSMEYQGQEIDNVVHACNAIGDKILSGDDCLLTVGGIKDFNRLVLEGLPLAEDVVPGEVSRHNVVVATYRGAPRPDCELLLEKLCEWINGIQPPAPDQRIAFAVLRAVVAHLYLAWIHPFGDGNGRTARLIEFQVLLGAGVPSIVAHLLSNHYNQTRSEYYRHLDLASKSGGDVLPFLRYAVQGLRDGLTGQIDRIRRHLWAVSWKDYVYESFRGQDTIAAVRQRKVALALGGATLRLIPMEKIRFLSPEIAAAYAGKTKKTVMRDLNALRDKQLISFKVKNVRARREVLQQLLPRRRDERIRR